MYNFSEELFSNNIKASVKTDAIITKIDEDKTSVFFLNFEEKKNKKETNVSTRRKIKALII